MEMKQIIEQAEKNIWQAIRDYGAHTRSTYVLDDVGLPFVSQLARDSAHAKQELRELFSKSPAWDEKLDALVINGTRTHDPDPKVVSEIGHKILSHANSYDLSYTSVTKIIRFFAHPENEDFKAAGIEQLNFLAPKAYAPGKKLSRVFKALCDALGVTDNTAGSEFQRLYAQFADELSAKRISFKLFVSINPAHFITMSNPKNDARGTTLTSCHSFNSTEYGFNNGCSGYARDKVSFIVFTVDDPTNPESLNNRKTTRQIYAYKPGNGLLLQSRLYNTSGGTRGAQAESKVYRDLIQREISMLEGEVNLWKTYPVAPNKIDWIRIGAGFGGYADWIYADFNAMVSFRADHATEYEPLTVGTWGLCICCGEEINDKLYCCGCDEDGCSGNDDWHCDRCGDWADEDERYRAHDAGGHEISVCETCHNEYYERCDECEEDFDSDAVYCVTGSDGCSVYVCENCRDEYYTWCDWCGDYFHDDTVYSVTNENGLSTYVCEDCLNQYYEKCDECGGYHHENRMVTVHASDASVIRVCPDCCQRYHHFCEDCGRWFTDEMVDSVRRPDGAETKVCHECAKSYEICPA